MKSIQADRARRRAISLLEVVLALAILGIAAAYLAQSMQLSSQNALRAQRLTQAELVFESVMNQVIAGLIPAEASGWVDYTATSANGSWRYMIEVGQAELEGMIAIRIAVQEIRQAIDMSLEPPDLVATRWIIDPTLNLDVPPQTADGSTSGSNAGGSAASGGATSATGGVQ